MSEANLLGEWSRLLLHGLARAGIRDVVISPGSRSTPFVVAAVEHPDLRCTTLTDERSAAFFALGQARASGEPSLLVCTSGTAGAHYLPAVVEARLAGVPLVVLTADRPGELSDCGAPQTADQVKLFGDHAVHFAELGTPDAHPAALRGLLRIATQAVLRSRWPRPGAVHLNARARKPLEPRPARTEEELHLAALVHDLIEAPLGYALPPRALPDPGGVEHVATAIAAGARGLVVAGPAGLGQGRLRPLVDRLAALAGYGLAAEGTSQLRFGGERGASVTRLDGLFLLLESERFRERFAVDVVIQIGRAPVSAAWERFVAERHGVERFVISDGEWHDPTNNASLLLFGDLEATLETLVGRLEAAGAGSPDRAARAGEWTRALAAANRRLAAEVQRVTAPPGGAGLEEGTVARTVVESLPAGSLLAVGNSLPIREVERYAAGLGPELEVWCQRGANGIDGIVSGVAGTLSVLAQGAAPPPLGLLLLGDVSFLHDLSGLAAAREITDLPFVIVVVNNDGGRIFEQLPVASAPELQGRLDAWLTPHGLRLGPAAELYGLPCLEAATLEELERALEEARARPGATVVEVRVAASGAAAQKERLAAAVEAIADEATASLAPSKTGPVRSSVGRSSSPAT